MITCLGYYLSGLTAISNVRCVAERLCTPDGLETTEVQIPPPPQFKQLEKPCEYGEIGRLKRLKISRCNGIPVRPRVLAPMSTQRLVKALLVYALRENSMSKYVLDQVRELLSRNLDSAEIARRLHIEIGYVLMAIDCLKE